MYLPFHHIILHCVEARYPNKLDFYFIHIQYKSGIEFCFLILAEKELFKGSETEIMSAGGWSNFWDYIAPTYFPCFSKYRATIRKLDTKGTVNYIFLMKVILRQTALLS